MIPYLSESRSKPYDEEMDAVDAGPGKSHWTFPWGEVLFTLFFPVLIVLFCLYPFLYAAGCGLYLCGRALAKLFHERKWAAPVLLIVILAALLFGILLPRARPVPAAAPAPTQPVAAAETKTVTILVDDFKPQPYQGQSVYFYNRLEGDRGAVNNSLLTWGDGSARLEVAPRATWGGVWMSLNHPMREGLPVNFSAVLPAQIRPAYQSRVTALSVVIESGTPGRTLRFELKDGETLRWKKAVRLTGQPQSVQFNLPTLGEINQLVWVLDDASPGDFVILKRISLRATHPIDDTPTAAFVWSYAMLLDNWNPDTGLVRDKAKDASGEFDAVQATGSLAAATALAEQLGVVEYNEAAGIVQKINVELLKLPRYHGLWPHWVQTGSDGQAEIVANTEWSSVDTVIAALGLLDAQSALDLDTAQTEQVLRDIDWQGLLTSKGMSHGYDASGRLIPYAWDTFGGESWLVQLAYASASGNLAPMEYPTPPTANGSGFIDELAWLYLPPPTRADAWGTAWADYRSEASARQISYAARTDSNACNAAFGLFGLSASEVPDPARVPPASIYQAFGLGGRFAGDAVEQTGFEGSPVISPHYAAMVAALHPSEADRMWSWLIDRGLFSPLNNVESLVIPRTSVCDPDALVWNQLKGSWNLSLQTLGWGSYLAQRGGQTPAVWQAARKNAMLSAGYRLLVPEPPAPAPTAAASWTLTRECETGTAAGGQMIQRSDASNLEVYGQFGTASRDPWPAVPGYVLYDGLEIPSSGSILLNLRYSKNSPAGVPILVYLDGETEPRAVLALPDQRSWNAFTWTGPISLGPVTAGTHWLKFYTDGQQYGVADLDVFTLEMDETPPPPAPTEAAPTPFPVQAEPQGLLVWYDFEEDLSSGQVSDRSGSGLDARLNGQAETAPGISGGNAVLFSGNGFLQAERNPAAGKTNITFSLWFKTDNPRENYKLASAAWWQQGPASGWIMATHMPELWSDDTRSLYPEGININDNDFVPGQWNYEVLTYDGERIKEYTNGMLVNDWPSTGQPIGSGVPMMVGAWLPYTAYNFAGALDEFQIFDRCLTAEEIRAIYEQNRPDYPVQSVQFSSFILLRLEQLWR